MRCACPQPKWPKPVIPSLLQKASALRICRKARSQFARPTVEVIFQLSMGVVAGMCKADLRRGRRSGVFAEAALMHSYRTATLYKTAQYV